MDSLTARKFENVPWFRIKKKLKNPLLFFASLLIILF